MISLKFLPVILLAVVALQAQEPTITNDGCNTTSCLNGLCSTTTAYCGPVAGLANVSQVSSPRTESTPLPPTICGVDHRAPTANIQLIQVACIDFDRLRALAPGYPWPVGRVTQVLVHAKQGDRVYVSVDGGKTYRKQKLVRDAEGRLVALMQWDGAEYTSVDVDVVPEAAPE